MTPTNIPEAARLAEELRRYADLIEDEMVDEPKRCVGDAGDCAAPVMRQAADALSALAKQDAAPTSAARNVGDDLRKLRFVYRVLDNFAEAPQSDRADAYVMVRELIESTWKSGAAPTSASTVPEWLPIETAPKDGTTLYLHKAGKVSEGSWLDIPFIEYRDTEGCFIDQQDSEAYWMDHESGDMLDPTEWMPKVLPTPPGACSVTDGEAK